MSVLPEQAGGLQRTLVSGWVQAAPLVPATSMQVAAQSPLSPVEHEPWPAAGAPITAEQVPGLGLTLHASQTLSQALLQQYPSAQVCDTQSPLPLHFCPFGRSPHEPFVQVLLGEQSVLVWHDSVQPVLSALQR